MYWLGHMMVRAVTAVPFGAMVKRSSPATVFFV
jgi:hypothetical protein